MNYKAGDGIDLEMSENHEVKVANVPPFTASLGDSRGRFAIEFEQFIEH